MYNSQNYKKALQLQKLSQSDDSEVQTLTEVEGEMDEIIKTLGELGFDGEKLGNDLNTLIGLSKSPNDDSRLTLVQLADFLDLL